MATQTSNLGLTKPGYDEAADVVPAVNNNMDAIDAAMGAVPANTSVQAQITANAQAIAKLDESIAIVSNGNTHAAIAAGQYVYIKGHGTLAEGLYTANSAISANATLSNSNVTAVSGGGLNALNSKLTIKSKQIPGVTVNANGYADQQDSTLKSKPIVGYELTSVASRNVSVLAIMCNNAGVTIRIKNNGSEQITTGSTTIYYLDI